MLLKFKTFVCVALLMMISTAAVADDNTQIMREICNRMVRYQPEVGVTYQPGIDVRGHPVVPANDSPPFEFELPDPIVINLNIDMAQRLGITLPAGIDMDADLGVLAIHRDGRVYLNGQSIQYNRGAVLCPVN